MTEGRAALLADFLAGAGWGAAEARPLAGDASARRYLRLSRDGGSAVLMDADPGRGERVDSFLAVGDWLLAAGYSAPRCLAADPINGFLLLEDLGDALFASLVARDRHAEAGLYATATDFLADLHRKPPPDFLKKGDGAALGALTAFVGDWYVPAAGGEPGAVAGLPDLIGRLFNQLGGRASVVSLRDFHAENLIWLPERQGVARVGLLDFQDAFVTDPAYDLVSLCQDARRDVSPATEAACVARYLAAAGVDSTLFRPIYALIGAQRALRIIGVFARLCVLGGKPRYLEFLPRVWSYLQRNLSDPALSDLAALVRAAVPVPDADVRQRIASKCATTPAP